MKKPKGAIASLLGVSGWLKILVVNLNFVLVIYQLRSAFVELLLLFIEK